MNRESILATVKVVPEALSGLRRARITAGRQVIEQTESGCFGIYFANQTGYVPSEMSISLVSRTQDWMERFNRNGDEEARETQTEEPFWQKDHLVSELANLQIDILEYIQAKYRGDDQQKRSDIIMKSFDEYIKTTCIVEDWMTERKKMDSMTENEIRLLGELPSTSPAELPKLYRLHNDTMWLNVLTLILADGDEKVANASMKSLLSGVMLFQISDDFIFSKRNRTVNKVALFVNEDSSITNLNLRAEEYFNGLNLPKPMISIIKMLWFVRSVYGKTQMDKRNDTYYGNDELFKEINQFEQRIYDQTCSLSKSRNIPIA